MSTAAEISAGLRTAWAALEKHGQLFDFLLTAANEIDRLSAQVAEMLPWARLGATVAAVATDDDAAFMRNRIEAGEFGKVQ